MNSPSITLVLTLAFAPLAAAQNWYPGIANYPEATINAQFVAAGDFDNDGDVDTLVRGGGNLETWLNVGGRGRLELGPVLMQADGTKVNGFESRVLDFDGDGNLDVTAWRSFPATQTGFVLLRGQGDGSFTEEFLALDGALYFSAYGDFDGSGTTDFAVLLSGAFPEFRLGWARWVNGGLDLGGTAVLSNVNGYSDLAGVDWDGDGVSDFVAATEDDLEIWSGTGSDPAFFALQDAGLVTHALIELVAADFDGSGRQGLFVGDRSAGFNPSYRVYEATGPGVLTSFALSFLGGEIVGQIRAADWDGDGDLDLFSNSTSFSEKFALIENTELQGFRGRGVISGGASGVLPALVDIDGDQNLDAVLPRGIVFGNGVVEQPWPTGFTSSTEFAFLDREGDGDLDRFFPSGFVELNNGVGELGAGLGLPPTPSGFRYTGSVAVGDLTGDGRADFLSGYETDPGTPFEPSKFIEMRLIVDDGLGGYADVGAAGPPGFRIQTPFSFFGPVRSFLVDLDADGDSDLLLGNGFWENKGTAAAPFFDALQTLFSNPAQAVADIDADGDTDVITLRRNNTPQVLRLERNSGGLTFAPEIIAAESVFSSFPSLLDLDADGDLDVAISLETPQSRLLLLTNVGGSYTEVANFPTTLAGFADLIVVEDVDADGISDLVLGRLNSAQNYPDHHLSVLRGTGAPYDFEFGGTWNAGGIGGFIDADQDGDLDAYNANGPLLSTRFEGPSAGLARQYGAGSAGSGGAVPVLGATGPWRVGSPSAALRIAVGNGGAPAFLAISPAEDLLIDFPFAGLTTLVSPGLINLLQFGLDGVGAGDGELVLPVTLSNPAFAGVNRFHQVFIVDAGAASLLALTNGLEILIGG